MKETFERVEKKYVLSCEKYNSLLKRLEGYIEQDKYFQSSIRSIYYDNDAYQMINRSMESPEYKEKIRIRAYENNPRTVYVEFKRKLDGIVYKRRTKALYPDVLDINHCDFTDKQVGKELSYTLKYYGEVKPKVFIGVERKSYLTVKERIRITFDENMVYRFNNLSLERSEDDKSLGDYVVMEIKVSGSYPMWLSEMLSEEEIFPCGHSKVKEAMLREMGGNRDVTF
ncbi:MAG: VTC domain-containing protein [Erysipelotrichaceae bacterium]